jgi:hypothetical protein
MEVKPVNIKEQLLSDLQWLGLSAGKNFLTAEISYAENTVDFKSI